MRTSQPLRRLSAATGIALLLALLSGCHAGGPTAVTSPGAVQSVPAAAGGTPVPTSTTTTTTTSTATTTASGAAARAAASSALAAATTAASSANSVAGQDLSQSTSTNEGDPTK